MDIAGPYKYCFNFSRRAQLQWSVLHNCDFNKTSNSRRRVKTQEPSLIAAANNNGWRPDCSWNFAIGRSVGTDARAPQKLVAAAVTSSARGKRFRVVVPSASANARWIFWKFFTSNYFHAHTTLHDYSTQRTLQIIFWYSETIL